ncbi:carbohydrate porin [Frateuria sp. STR12]|uniref:carbohydrate porin n=1 Tax=Frateuria hangzhouensis TaxID=2995589 RepID=UPI00226103B4|nr:carbohydrate porin [Frateuria sp. STR12]MCX7514888.1 carbohydrate porin [Frateuria sp. STR12]
MTIKPLACAIALGLAASLTAPLHAAEAQVAPATDASAQMAAMQAQIDALQHQLDAMRQQQAAAAAMPVDSATESVAAAEESRQSAAEAHEDGIKLGGAVRFQYSREGYSEGNRKRRGDMDFDIFRLDLDGSIGDVELSAQYRWFQYMGAIHHAWVGYKFTEQDEGQLGITRVPFGNQPFDSHSYFFSSNYYLGLEDAYQMGALYVHSGDPWNVQLGFFKNDSMGGVDGFVSNRADSYTYNVVGYREPGEGGGDDPLHPIGVADTAVARVGYTFHPADDAAIEVGVSALRGSLEGSVARAGDYDAEALHANANLGRWNLQLQAARYAYQINGGADRIAVGAYDFYDSIAARARSWTGNLAYTWPVSWGPVTALTFYNDYSMVNRKSGGLPHTWMNITGMSVAAGGLFTYFDFVTARNQPFIGGSMVGDGEVEHRFNINFGYYF